MIILLYEYLSAYSFGGVCIFAFFNTNVFIKNLLTALPHMNLRKLKGKGQKSLSLDCTGKYYNVIEK